MVQPCEKALKIAMKILDTRTDQQIVSTRNTRDNVTIGKNF
jgi:hypothetical protein